MGVNAGLDENSRPTLTALSNADGVTIVDIWADPVTHRLLVSSVSTANLIIGTSTITSGTNGLLLYDNNGVVGELALATYPSLTELSYVKGVTSGIQSQLNGKQATLTNPVTGTGTQNGIAYWASASTVGTLAVATYPSLTELSYVKGVTSGIQSQINGKQTSGTYLTPTSTNIVTNKRNAPRIYSIASIAGTPGTLTPEIDTYDYFELTAQAAALNIANSSTSTPTGGERMIIAITSDATPRALTYGTNYAAKGGIVLPTTTVASKTTTLGFIYNAGLTKWNLVAVAQEV